MSASTAPSTLPVEFSLVRGGPLYRLLVATRLTSPSRPSAVRPAVVIAGIAWLPLFVIGAFQLIAFGRMEALLQDPSVVTRFLISVPLFFAAEFVLDHRCAVTARRFIDGGFAEEGAPAVERVLRRAEELRSMPRAELLLALFALIGGQGTLWGVSDPSGWIHGAAGEHAVTAARVWYGFVALPIYQFLLYRWLWRWSIWSLVLFKLSRFRLRLAPMHPDHTGGIGMLVDPAFAFTVFIGGAGVVLASAWGTQIVVGHVPLQSFIPSAVAWVMLAMSIAFGPLLLFSGHLARARYRSRRVYGRLAMIYTRLFDRRWVDAKADDETVLGSPDFQSLNDLIGAYESMRQMRFVPFGLHEALLVAAGAIGPLLPLATAEIPLRELLIRLAGALL